MSKWMTHTHTHEHDAILRKDWKLQLFW